MKKNLFLLLFFLVVAIQAQTDKDIVVQARALKKSIMLRWAPTHAEAWQLANQKGYMLYRYTILRDKKLVPQPELEILSPDTLKVAPLTEWETYAKDDDRVLLGAGAIYNSSFEGRKIGGNVMLAFRKHQETEQRFGFALMAAEQSRTVAELSALFYEDVNVKPNEKYLYRIFVPGEEELDTGYVFTGVEEYIPLPKPLEFEVTWDNKMAYLKWNKKYLQRFYSSYYVERSEDNIQFTRITKSPITNLEGVDPMYMVKKDSLPENFKTYYYRVLGINAFSEHSPYSDTISGHGYEPVEVAPTLTTAEAIDNKLVKIDWMFPEKFDSLIEGFTLYRAYHPSESYQAYDTISDVKQRTYIDSFPDMNNYYKLSVLVDSIKELKSVGTRYVQLIDSFPPSIPTGLSGIIDSTGLVQLNWTANSDKDIGSYRIYRANMPEEEFTRADNESIKLNQYQERISLDNLSSEIFYKVSAVDKRGNESSQSAHVSLIKPDKIPPVSPFFTKFIASDSGIYLSWVNSSSADLKEHLLERTIREQNSWKIIQIIPYDSLKTGSYFDSDVSFQDTYTYNIYALDRSGNRSKTIKTVTTKRIDNGLRASPYQIKVETEDVRNYHISWKLAPMREKPITAYLYKLKPKTKENQEDEFEIVAESEEETPLKVKIALNEEQAWFKIKVILEDNKETRFSDVFEIER